jgi:hypothetical protein
VRFAFPRHPAEFEIPDDWWAAAGMSDFTSLRSAYNSASGEPIQLVHIEPPFRPRNVHPTSNGFNRERLALEPFPVFVAAACLVRLGDRQRPAVARFDHIVRPDDRSAGIGLRRWPEPLRLEPSGHLIDLIARRRRLARAGLQFLRIVPVYGEIGVMRRDQVGEVDDLMAYVERSGGIIDLISRDLSRYSLTAFLGTCPDTP